LNSNTLGYSRSISLDEPFISPWVLDMPCKACHSDKQRVFNGEIAIHFPGLEGLNKSMVWVFPRVVICLHCAFAEFVVPEREMQVLAQGAPLDGAVILEEKNLEPPKNARAMFGSPDHTL
jgi:hypothetical protein